MAINRETVFEAAQRLAERGERISVRQVRQEIGGGSPNEITPWVREWHAQHTEQQRQVKALDEMPAEARQALAEPMETLLARMWALLRNTTTAEVDALRQSYDVAKRALQEEAAEQTALAQGIYEEAEQLRNQLAQAQQEIASLRTALAEEHEARQRERLETVRLEERSQALREERERLLGQIEQQDQHLQRKEAALAEADRARSQSAQDSASTRIRLEEASAQLEDLRTRLDRSEQRAETLEARLSEAQTQARAAEAEAAELRGHLAEHRQVPPQKSKRP